MPGTKGGSEKEGEGSYNNSTVQYSTVLGEGSYNNSTVHYSTVQYSTVQYREKTFILPW